MEFFLGLMLGAVAGVIAERLLGYPLDRYLIAPVATRRTRNRLEKLNKTFAVSGELLVLGRSALFIHQFFPVGIDHRHLSAQMSRTTSDLDSRLKRSSLTGDTVTIAEVEAAQRRWLDELAADPKAWNGEALALEQCEVGRIPNSEEPVLHLWFRQTDYASARASEEFWLAQPLNDRRHLDGSILRSVDPFFSNGFGLNCTVATSDGHVLLSRRGPKARGWVGSWHTSFNEAVSVEDRPPGRDVDLIGAFGRGLKEELGLDPAQLPGFRDALTIHTLMLDVDTYQWGLLAHLNLSNTEFTSERLRGLRNLGAAPDDWEASEIRFIRFDSGSQDVVAEIERSEEWVPHGLLNLALSAIVEHPTHASQIREALLQQAVK